jgi:hypothetical protein
VNFQVTILKVAGELFRRLGELGRPQARRSRFGYQRSEWSERNTRLAIRVPGLEMFAQRLVERLDARWRHHRSGAIGR